MTDVSNKKRRKKKGQQGVRWRKQMKNNQTWVVKVAVLRRVMELLGKQQVLIKTDKKSGKT